MHSACTTVIVVLTCFTLLAWGSDDTIDFETIPGGTPVDNLPIDTQYRTEYGVSFGIDLDGDGFADPGLTPFLEETGAQPDDPMWAFDSHWGDDTAAPGLEVELGKYCLRGIGNQQGESNLIVLYSDSVNVASGEIWDIDGNPTIGSEGWRIEAMGRDYVNNNDPADVIDSIKSPISMNTDLDGKRWVFLFDRRNADIYALRMIFIGTKTTGIGIAFNNFSHSVRTSIGVVDTPLDVAISNYPNPFNPMTRIEYALPQSGWISIWIYDIRGRLVRTLVDEYRSAGWHEAVWHSQDDQQQRVASGVYLYVLQTPQGTKTKRMVVAR